jgi:predicted PurR-regulated permease PerM
MTTRAPLLSGSSAALWILALIAALFFLRTAKELFLPIALSVLFSYALAPVVNWLERSRVPRWLGAALVLLAAVAALLGGAYALRDDLTQVLDALPAAIERAQEMLRSQLGYSAGSSEEALPGMSQAANAVLSIAGHAVVIVFLIFFLLLAGHDVRDRVVEIAGPDGERRRTTATIIDDINAQIQRYLLVLLFTAAVVAAATTLVLAWMGVEHAIMWGTLAGLFNSIPYFGPVIVSGGLFVVGLVQGGGMTEALEMSGAAIVITSLEGWLLTPPLMGKVERMNALTVFIGLLVWTWLWGAWGTILAVPMLAIIKSVADHIVQLKPLGRMMAP